MAAKKKVSKKKVSKKKTDRKTSTSKAMVSMDDFKRRSQADAERDSTRIAAGAGGSYISLRNGRFQFQDADLGKELDVVVLGFCSENVYYDSPWDPDDPNSPACAAIGMDDNDYLIPDEKSPEVQADSCEECEYNEWGSASVGGGKMCSNRKRLLVAAVDDLLAGGEVETPTMGVAPTSIGNFNKYVKGLDKVHHSACYAMITKLEVDEDDDKVINFSAVEPVDDNALAQAIMERLDSVEGMLVTEYDFSNYHKPQPKRRGSKKKTSNKKTGKKKTSKKKGSKFAR